MKKKLDIDCCSDCKHACCNYSVMQEPVVYCAKSDRLIPDNGKTIPEFCLLDDAE